MTEPEAEVKEAPTSAPLTPEQRLAACQQELEVVLKKYNCGVTLAPASIHAAGDVWVLKPVMTIVPMK